MSENNSRPFNWTGLGYVLGAIVAVLVVLAVLFRMTFVNFIDNYQIGYKFDTRDGKITILSETGYVVNPPYLVKVHTVDLRPMQVCINANQRVLNCKLVQFNKEGLDLFLSWHGRTDYEGNNLNEILKSYAYDGSGKNYPFLTIIRELKPEESVPEVKK